MYNKILEDSLKVPQTEFYYLATVDWKGIEKYILETKSNLKNIKIIILRNRQFNLFVKNGGKESFLIFKKKLLKSKDTEFWSYLSWHNKISIKFAKEFKNKLNWRGVSYNAGFFRKNRLSENFIRKFQDKVDWGYISRCQKLSEEFIREFQDRVDWFYISHYQKLSEDFIREFQHRVI